MTVREGLVRLEGVESVSEHPVAANATCEIRSRGGQWLNPDLLARQIVDIQVGARLRGIEATIKGRLEQEGPRFYLRPADGTERVQLLPLTQKVQLDTRSHERQNATLAERLAFENLREEWKTQSGPVLITGPLAGGFSSGTRSLEVRRFVFAAPQEGGVRKLKLGLEVNGPYGLGEPWGAIRDGLLRHSPIRLVEEQPDLAGATCEVWLHPGERPDPEALARAIEGLSVGASLRGVEATLDGWLTRRWGRLKLHLPEPIGTVALAPLVRKIEREGKRNQTASLTAEERAAYQLLRAQAKREPRFARVIGPLSQSRRGQLVLETRRFALAAEQFADLEEREAAERIAQGMARAGASSAPDSEAPAAPKNLLATRAGSFVNLDWDDNEDPDFGSYNIFRSTASGSGYIQVAAGVVPSAYRCWVGEADEPYYFVVTATDYSGNQSPFSGEARADRAHTNMATANAEHRTSSVER